MKKRKRPLKTIKKVKGKVKMFPEYFLGFKLITKNVNQLYEYQNNGS